MGKKCEIGELNNMKRYKNGKETGVEMRKISGKDEMEHKNGGGNDK